MGIERDIVSNAVLLNDENQMALTVKINNKEVEMQVPAIQSLAVILRDYFQLTGTKVSCGIGRCGACSVLVDGELVNSCLMMAYQANGKSITTIEGIKDFTLHDVQAAFLKEGGFQCGYCTPGMVMAVKALLDRNPNPQESEIKEALAGNLCRCTGYGGIVRAVQYLITQKNH